jgi:hypothetical protein
MQGIKIEICIPPDRKKFVSIVMIGNRQFCELNQEDGILKWEFYPNDRNLPWVIDDELLMSVLKQALEKLPRY